MKLVISTCEKYYKTTLNPLICSLIKARVCQDSVLIVVGGSKEEVNFVCDKGFHHVKIRENSFDLTGLIYVVENNLESNYWFLLHDTCYVGLSFWHRITTIPPHYPNKIALKAGMSMNIGAYKWEYLLNNKRKLLKAKNFNNTETGLQKCKHWAIRNEDYLLQPNDTFYGGEPVLSGIKDFYGNGIERLIEYYPQIDLYKLKANWFLKNVYAITP